MERKIYTTPRTKLFSVELEGTFAGSATGTEVDPMNSGVTSTGQQTTEIDFSGEDWNNGSWE